ncbi:MAG TPA: methyltransferase domain-containing protein [Candidatus Baltobacteraceae bacterium]|jgi:predicted SAM-dependent methyltransferase|nr:methyltransferase domain-containing protein [Candidatus Baltobacteraceae bacterium]
MLSLDEVENIRQQLTVSLEAPDITYGLSRAFRCALKELDLYRNHFISRAQLAETPKNVIHPHVQIGGGNHRIEGFFNIDIVPPADLVWDIRESIPLSESSVELLFSEHFLEHIDYPRSVKHYIAELYRVLRSDGQVITGVPDAEIVLNAYQKRDCDLFATIRDRWYANRNCLNDFNTYLDLVNYVFRDQDDDEKYTPHLWAYDYEKVSNLFLQVGFKRVEPWEFNSKLGNPKRQWGSLYVIATK